MHVDWGKSTEGQSANKPIQSAKLGDGLPPKCKICTLEEIAVLRIIRENRSATQKEIAAAINLHHRILLESIPSADEHLDYILSAMKKDRILHIVYKKYDSDQEKDYCSHGDRHLGHPMSGQDNSPELLA